MDSFRVTESDRGVVLEPPFHSGPSSEPASPPQGKVGG